MSGPAVLERVDTAEARGSPAPGDVRPGARLRLALRRPGFAWSVAAAVLVAFALRAAIGLTDDAPTTDEVAYLASGVSLVEGDGFARGDHPELHFPPLVPFLLGVVSRVVADPHTATVLLTCLAGTALVVPVALLGRRVAGDLGGVATAGTAAVAPGLATLPATRGAGSEAEYALLVVTAVWLVVAAGAAPRRVNARLAGAGLSVGLAYLTRPEGLAFALPLGVAAAAVGWRAMGAPPTSASPSWRAGRSLAAFALPLVVCVVPYASYLHDHTGRWQLTAKTQDASVEAWHAVARGDREARDRVLYSLDESGLRLDEERAPLTTLARDDPVGYARIVATNVAMLGKDLAGWWLLPAPLWALAGWGAWRRRRSRGVSVVVAVAALPVGTALAFFVQPRYLIVTVAMATVLVGAAVPALSARWRRPVVLGGLALALTGSLVTFVGPAGWWHPTDHTDQRAAGEWLAERTSGSERIMTRSFVVEHYAGRTAVAVPYTDLDGIVALARHYGVRYLAVDETSARRVRPQLLPLLGDDEVPGLRLVHEERAEGRTTRVLALDPAPPASSEAGPTLGFMGDGG